MTTPTPSTPTPAADPQHGRRLSITDFLTDGSLAGLCAQLTELTGVEVQLRDAEGRLITRAEGSGWAIRDDVPLDPLPHGAVAHPLRIGAERIGSIIVYPGTPALGVAPRQNLDSVVALLTQAAGELCEHEVELRHRIKELGALYKLSSMLAHTGDVAGVLGVALDLALDVLALDAGSIMLLREDADGIVGTTEDDLILHTSRGLSKDWLDYPQPLSKDRLFDRLALNGAVVVSEDIAADDRIQIRHKAAEEGLRAAIHAGLVFQGRPLGVIRLYARQPTSFSESDRRLLSSFAHQAAVAIEQARLQRVRQEESRIQRQLQLAADVQRRMLPQRVPTLPRLDIAARYIPSFELGGDFYDFIELHGHLGIVVGDVVGKGVAAALLMAAVRSSLRAHAEEVYDLDTVVSKVNAAMCRDTLDKEFATLWYGVLNPVDLRLTYCCAGHEPPMVIHVPKHRAPTTADLDELSVGGMVVGVDRSQRYQRAVFDLRPRDVFVAYTDGVTDATAFSKEKFGKKRLRKALIDILTQEPDASAHRILDLLQWEVRRFTGLSARNDDETLVVLRVV